MSINFSHRVDETSAFVNLNDFNMSDVEVLNDYEQNAFALEVKYLKSLDADRLMKGFCDIAGVESSAIRYGGWETSSIQGHTLGHYLCAVSQAYATSRDFELKQIVDHIVSVLAQCQDAETGYLAAIPESHYAKIEQGDTTGTWVPWYTMHKVMAGLIAAYELADHEQALEVASKLGDWVYGRTSKWTEDMQRTVLNVEYGGMNDCLYQLYSHTKSPNHLSAAHSFDELPLFDSLYHGQDVLNGKHANTTIPKVIGALNRYSVLGDEYYLQAAENFWEIVVNSHTYITGGNSEWEHFGEANILDAERTNCNCETCNTYNMLKLTRELFKITGNRKYADHYENTFVNAILSSQNPETGMTTYFQPMATGYFKVYSSETEHFWCCTGSGMENFTKLGDSIYFKAANSVYVIRFSSSKLTWTEKGLVITQTADLPNVTFTVNGSAQADILLRVPDWCAGDPVIRINGIVSSAKVINGFVHLSREWNDGDIIAYFVPMEVAAFDLPDNQNAVAFKYGPWVLSANLGSDGMQTGTTGVNVTIPMSDPSISDVITIKDGTIASWLGNINNYLLRQEGTLNFVLKGTDRELTFSPHYLQYKNRYGIYFKLADLGADAEKIESGEYTVIDSLPISNDQYEFSHNMQAYLSATGNHSGLNYRDAAPGGFFSYDLKVDGTLTNYLCVKYFSGDAGRMLRILIDGLLLKSVTIENKDPSVFYDVCYEIPAQMVSGKDKITVTVEAYTDSCAGGIFDKLSIASKK